LPYFQNIQPFSRAFHWLLSAWLLLPFGAVAQAGFDQPMTFEQIQDTLREGIAKRDLRKQALAWYKWAYYDEQQAGNSDSAFQYLARSAERFGKSGDSVAYQRARSDLADRLADRSLWDSAEEIQREALAFFQRKQNLLLEAHLLARLNRLYLLKGDTAQAARYEEFFVGKNRILKDTVLEITVLMNETKRFQQDQRYRDARYRAYRVLQLATPLQRPDFITWAQFAIGENSYFEHDYQTALQYLRKAERSNQRSGAAMRRSIYQRLADTYTALDSLPNALYYSKRYGQLGDTLLNRDRALALQRLALQFDTREKRRAIEALEQEKNVAQEKANEQRFVAATLAVALCAVMLAAFFIFRDFRHRLHVGRVIAAKNEEINRRKIRELEGNIKIETMQSVLVGQESERQRIAQDLHDSVGGLLAAIKIHLEGLSAKKSNLAGDEGFVKIKNLLDDTVAETRHIARNMQPSALLEFGLVTAVRDLTGRVRSEGPPAITFQHFGDFSALDQTTALYCYRIVQELLQNSLKHAQAKEILVQLTQTENQLALLVEDDGVGFDQEKVQKGMGTDNITHRVHFLKGELSVQTAKGQGTSTVVTVPLPEIQGLP
jgi:signal transduction histidine kinase